MGRKEDLEGNIRESYDLIRQYETIGRETDRPKERRHAGRVAEEQWGYIKNYLDEYIPLCERLRQSISAEFLELAARFPEYDDRLHKMALDQATGELHAVLGEE